MTINRARLRLVATSLLRNLSCFGWAAKNTPHNAKLIQNEVAFPSAVSMKYKYSLDGYQWKTEYEKDHHKSHGDQFGLEMTGRVVNKTTAGPYNEFS